ATEPPVVDPTTETVIIDWASGGHNGCTVAFGPDGTMFISTGDGASPDPPDGVFHTGQDNSDLLSAVLRIDVDHPSGVRAYSIPANNPFRDTPGARPEIWAFGFRNPFRMSVDEATGDVWVGDVGWEQWEMVYRLARGGNYGWPITEGPNRQVRTDVKQGPGPILPPMVALPHSEAASITGGRVVHRGPLTALRGTYVYGDWETGKFWALRQKEGQLISNEELCDTVLKPVAFAEAPDGDLVILDHGGGLHRLVPNQAPPANQAFPRRLSETGVFANVARHEPAAGVVSYQPRAAMWSDHAMAERLVAIPGDARIGTAGGRETIVGRMWDYPSNTVFTRTLTLPSAAPTAAPRRVETQMLHFDGQTWNAYTYRWNEAQTDAELIPAEGARDRFTVDDPQGPGGKREVSWRFLGRSECFRCHNVWAGDLLSFQWNQLGDPTGPSEAARMIESGVLRVVGGSRDPQPLVSPADETAPLERRARSWLHVNCAGCHRFGSGGGVSLYLNDDKPLAELRAVEERPTRGDFGLPEARLIAAGDPFRSVLFYRILTEGSARMPHIGAQLVDTQGTRLIGDWIRSLPRSKTPAPTATAMAALAQGAALSLGQLDGPQRGTAITRLLGSMHGALALLHRCDQPEAERPGVLSLRRQVAEAAQAHGQPMVRDLFQRLLPPSERRRTLGADVKPAQVLDLVGDVLRGHEVFTGVAQCVRCHVRDGNGRAFGPDLTGLSQRQKREQVLESILTPSRVIAPEYKTTNLLLKDDTEVAGFLVRHSASEWVIKDANAVVRTFSAAEVSEVRTSDLSAMPEGLLGGLTAQEAADLLAYLMAESK
ncbi:MAG: PQQ-dependent sugar dehydrogenase, partial [Verrucomicrobiales bacterium]|nr:PQQ-dependent sugar dehydrogenase [Verrucomicrobiales bacterium]